MPVKYPCKICSKAVENNHRALQCDECDTWVHIKCNQLNSATYKILKEDKTPWYCIQCTKSFFPYGNVRNHELPCVLEGKNIKLAQGNNILIGDEKKSLISNLNEAIRSTQNNNKNSEYYDINELNSIDSKCHTEMNIFHLNISSLSHNFDQLHTLLSTLNISFNFIGITESRIRKGKPTLNKRI